MSSGSACSQCECVCNLQHSQAKLPPCEVIKQVCSSLFPEHTAAFLESIYVPLASDSKVWIDRHHLTSGGIFHLTTVVKKPSRPLQISPTSHLPFFPSGLTIKAEILSMRKLPQQMSFYVFIWRGLPALMCWVICM